MNPIRSHKPSHPQPRPKPRQALFVQTGLFLLMLLTLFWYTNASPQASQFDFVVVANLGSGIDKMSKDEVINVYMGRNRKLASGISALPVEVNHPMAEKEVFYMTMVSKEVAEINSYWARLTFSGQGSPPKKVKTAEEALNLVIENKGAIVYLDRKKADKRVKIIFDPSK